MQDNPIGVAILRACSGAVLHIWLSVICWELPTSFECLRGQYVGSQNADRAGTRASKGSTSSLCRQSRSTNSLSLNTRWPATSSVLPVILLHSTDAHKILASCLSLQGPNGKSWDAQVVHRHLKSSNVLFSATERVALADAGLADLLDADISDHGTLGSFAWAAPELLLGERCVHPFFMCTSGADAWIFAAILHL